MHVRRALVDGAPIVGLWHSGGARLREGVVSLHAVGEVFAIMTSTTTPTRSAPASRNRATLPGVLVVAVTS